MHRNPLQPGSFAIMERCSGIEVFSAEVVELADTPSTTTNLDIPCKLLIEKQIPYSFSTYESA
jgi:hypothetical protein